MIHVQFMPPENFVVNVYIRDYNLFCTFVHVGMT